jgi:ubiquinone/menaquinone biosynthesis C-methylase UbiE
MAAGYAQHRPPLHSLILDRAFELWKPPNPVRFAIDLGCGSGLSTRPLQKFADRVIGIDPIPEMLVWANQVAPGSFFIAARTETLPLSSGLVDLATAAGSLNYCDLDAAFRELSRILSPAGPVCVYDFSQGRKFRAAVDLEEWFAVFADRYPMPDSEATSLSPETLGQIAAGFQLVAYENFKMGLPMDSGSYSDYLMTETNIASAIRHGADETEIRNWLKESLTPVFDGGRHEVLFRGYFAWLCRP